MGFYYDLFNRFDRKELSLCHKLLLYLSNPMSYILDISNYKLSWINLTKFELSKSKKYRD